MADNLGYTPGAGASIRTSQGSSSGAHMQMVKLTTGIEGDENFIPGTTLDGLLVNVSQVQGSVTVANTVASNLKVDASGAAVPIINEPSTTLAVSAPAISPLAVRLSTGAGFIDTFPVSIAGTVTVGGTVAVSGTPAVTQSGTWNIGAVTSITDTVTVSGTVALSGTSAVSGTVTANQGTAAAATGAWTAKITDGTNVAGITTLSGPVYALKVDVVKQVGGGYSQQDRTAFTDGTTFTEVMGGVFNDSMTAPGAGQAGYARITSYRALHANLRRNADGAELGIAATPLRVDPTGTTTQPVSGTVTVDQDATAWVNNLTEINGSAIAAAAGVTAAVALPVREQPSITGFWRSHATFAAASSQALHTPAGGKTAFIEGIVISMTTAGPFLLFDNSATDGDFGSYLYVDVVGSLRTVTITPARPIPLAAINNVLRWTATGSAAGDITVWGYDA